MTAKKVHVRELAGWNLDAYEHRPEIFDHGSLSRARGLIAQRPCFQTSEAVLADETAALLDSLFTHASRADLHEEMGGLLWSLGVIDLRLLLAFQRRLSLDRSLPSIVAPAQDDWGALAALAFGAPRSIAFDLVRESAAGTYLLQSGNPDLHLRVSKDLVHPVSVHGGSPFLEVAHYRGRWFLRDGYHRAYALLRAGIFMVPAVIVQANTLEELLGSAQPWFFCEQTLLSRAPPLVCDFLDDALVIEYDRPQLFKTIHIRVEETYTPMELEG